MRVWKLVLVYTQVQQMYIHIYISCILNVSKIAVRNLQIKQIQLSRFYPHAHQSDLELNRY